MKKIALGILALLVSWISLRGMSPEERKSFEAFEKRVEQGDAAAMYRMSAILENGYDTIAPDSLRALSLLKRSAEAGYADACNYLGYLYQEGQGIRQNVDSAYYWIGRAAAAGNPAALSNLVYYRLEGDSVVFDAIGALDRLSPTPERALENAISFYRRGAYPIAVELLRRVGPDNQSTPQAYALLGEAYSRGRGVLYDYNRSLEYYARAAALGNPSAMFVIAETLEFFPDALSGIEENLPDFETLRRQASLMGINTAEEAAEALLR